MGTTRIAEMKLPILILAAALCLVPAVSRAELEGMKIKTGEKAPDFTLRDLSGNQVTLSSLQGKKIVLLDFWATWCNVCKREMPVLERVYKEYKSKGVEFFGITLDENITQIKKVIESKGVTYATLVDIGAKVATEVYQLAGPIPLKVIIDKKGIVRYSHVGDDPEYPPEFAFVLDEILSETP